LKAPVKFDDYYLIERVAVGGMAEVFKGMSYGAEGFERLTAVKRVLPHIAEDKEFIEMFIDEAEIAAQLQHPNIGQVFHLGQSEGKYFIAMEFISGQDLRSIYDQGRERQEHLDLGWCAYMVREVCEALDYAHRKRDAQQRPLHLIHRDVSPQNILMSYDGSVKLIDFGIAKANNKINQTQVGILKGKFSYMSPEQARGLTLDARSDLFALAVVLYELVTLERCFFGQSDFSTIERVRNLEYTAPKKIRRDIPSALEKIIIKGLAKDPNDRYQSAADFQEALSRYLSKYAPQFTRAQAQSYMNRLFGAELRRERDRLEEFRAYAAQHIPEASRRATAGGRGRFDPQLSAPREESRPRFAQDGPRLSINPSDDRPRELRSSRPRRSLPTGSGPSLRARLMILAMLGMLAGGGAALFASARAPGFGQLHINATALTTPRFSVEGMGKRIEGQGPALVSELPSGDYTVTLQADGYQESRFAVRIEADQKTPLLEEPNLTPLPSSGFLSVSSTPNGALVMIDGVEVGQTPLVLASAKGVHQLELRLKGYEPLRQPVTFTPTLQDQGAFILFPEQVKVTVIPSVQGAQIQAKTDQSSAQWRTQGTGEQTWVISNTGRSLIKVSAPGYESAEVIFPRYPTEAVTEWVELTRLEGSAVKADAQISVKATNSAPHVVVATPVKERATSSAPTRQPAPEAQSASPTKRVTPTRRSRRSRRSTRASRTRRAPVRTRPRTPVREASPPAQEERQPGFLKLIATPPAEVIYQGRSLGWTPLKDKKFPEGRHRFTLRLSSGETYTISQDIPPGRSVLRRWRRP